MKSILDVDAIVVHFVGIGGIGMSGIADIMVNLGYKVQGSDIKESAITARLARKGVKIFFEHDAKNVKDASVVVVSSAILNSNPELVEARKLKIPVVKRAEMLAELMKMKKSIAIAGTHGKTTTTSLVSAVLDQADMDPTVINGGIINAYNSNARLGGGEWIVVEADESDGSFSRLISTVAVVTNIDMDHIDNFNSFDELRSLFVKFLENIPFYGLGILCIDHPQVAKIANSTLDRRILTYGVNSKADIFAENIKLSSQGSQFDVKFSHDMVKKYNLKKDHWLNLSLPMFGIHNVQNSLAAIASGLELNISEEDIRIALGGFMGVNRRFTKIVEVDGISVIDDYAHHPVEIEAVLKAAKSACFGHIYVVMQPHRYTRLKNFLQDFASILSEADFAFITPIYAAGEKSNGVDHFSLLERLKENRVKSVFVSNVEDLIKKTSGMLKTGDFLIFLGAGDITKWAHAFGKTLKNR